MTSIRELAGGLRSDDPQERSSAQAALRELLAPYSDALSLLRQFMQLVKASPELQDEIRALPDRLDAFQRLAEKHSIDGEMTIDAAWNVIAEMELQSVIAREAGRPQRARGSRRGKLPIAEDLLDEYEQLVRAGERAVHTLSERYDVDESAVRKKIARWRGKLRT